LAGRDDVLLEPVLKLLVKYVTDPRYGELTCSIAGIVIGTSAFISLLTDHILTRYVQLEMYSCVLGQSPLIDELFVRLRKKVEYELRLQQEYTKVKGALDMIFASSALNA
jgi:U3 small nucleolar RNA-associated protein 15